MNRISIIQNIIDALQTRTYLEIGVEQGACFCHIQAETKIGIDPIPPTKEVQAAGVYFQMSSDEFFASHAEGLHINVAFVDGLHEYRQVLRDVDNCLRLLSDQGAIIIHDCNPASAQAATPYHELETAMRNPEWNWQWSGDVWKAIVVLRTRQDLHVVVLDCDFGVGVIRKGVPESILPGMDVSQMAYKDFVQHRELLLNLKQPEYLETFLVKYIFKERHPTTHHAAH